MAHIHWPGLVDATITYADQDLLITVDELPGDPIGTLRIKAVAHVGTGVTLPNSTATSGVWTAVPGTSPTLEVRQDGHFSPDYIEIRGGDTPGGGGTTSGYVWDGATYVLDDDQRLFVGPSTPVGPQQGDIWFNTTNGTAVVQGFNLATSLPTTVTAGGVAHTKGAWTEIIASTDTPMAEIVLLVQSATGTSGAGLRGTLIDIGTGAAGVETAIVSNMDIGRTSAPQTYRIPISVPAGTRLTVRTQSLTPGIVFNVQLAASTAPSFAVFFGGNWIYAGVGTSSTTWGTSTANSLPTAVATPGAINTWSAWTQVEASTAARLRFLMILPSGPNAANWSAAPSALFDVGVGAAGLETSILDAGAVAFSWNTTELVVRLPLLIGVDIPAGSRLSVRYQATDVAQAATASLVGFF